MQPKISTKYPFDYDDMISRSKYAFIYDRCGNQGNASRPMVVISEDHQNNKCLGFEISTYNNGIEQHAEFSMPKDWVNAESLTIDSNKLICDWLLNQNEQTLINE